MARLAPKPILDVQQVRIDHDTVEQQDASQKCAAQGGQIGIIPGIAPSDDPKIRVLRARRRISTQIKAELLTASGCQPTVICDVSQFGAGLVGSHDVKKGEFVAIKLLGGRIVHGCVRWHRGNRCGIAFFEPLADDATLIGDADRTARVGLKDAQADSSNLAPTARLDPLARTALRHLWSQSIVAQEALRNTFQKLRGRLRELRAQRHQTWHDRAIERACREQGFAWLVEDETSAAPRRATKLD